MMRRKFLTAIGALTLAGRVKGHHIEEENPGDVWRFDATVDRQHTGICERTGEYRGFIQATAELPKSPDRDDIAYVVWRFLDSEGVILDTWIQERNDYLRQGDSHVFRLEADLPGDVVDKIADIRFGLEMQ